MAQESRAAPSTKWYCSQMTTNFKENTVTFVPKAYSKDDSTEVASSAREAVSLEFRGYKLVEDASDDGAEPTYAELQAQARDLNEKGHEIKVNAKHEDLLDAVIEAQVFQNEVEDEA